MNQITNRNNTGMRDLRCNQLLKHSDVRGNVLEIGAGNGINFLCMHNNSNIESYIGIEPNVHMYPYFYNLLKQWEPIPYEIRLSNSSAADMPDVPSNSIDTVIMTTVLCSIPDPLPEQVLREAHRVLKPGGKFLFFEHTEAHPDTKPVLHRLQQLIEPVWAIVGDGCRFKPITNYFDAVKDIYSQVDYSYLMLPLPSLLKDGVKGQLIK